MKKYLLISILVLIFGILLNQSVSFYLENKYETFPVLNDMFLDKLPYFNLVKVYDFLSILSMGLFVIYTYKKKELFLIVKNCL